MASSGRRHCQDSQTSCGHLFTCEEVATEEQALRVLEKEKESSLFGLLLLHDLQLDWPRACYRGGGSSLHVLRKGG